MIRALLAALLVAASAAVPAAEEMPSSAPLFAVVLDGMDGKPAALDKFRGKPLIVNFWARWCGPCRQEIPELAKLRAAHRKDGLEVIGIGLEDKPEAVREFAKAYDMDYPVLLAKDKGIPLMQALGNGKGGLPYTIAIDRQGHVVAKKLGLMQPADLAAAAAAALRK